MQRWNTSKSQDAENPKIDAFLAEVIAVSKKHGLSISHEDGQGAFMIEAFGQCNAEWLMAATDAVTGPVAVKTPVELFNDAIAVASAFSVDGYIFAINDGVKLRRIEETTPDDEVVLLSPDYQIPTTAGHIRKAKAYSAHFNLPRGTILAFYSTVPLA